MGASLRVALEDEVDRRASDEPRIDALACPACRRDMCVSSVTAHDSPVQLDLCRRCDLVWFDGGEHEFVGLPAAPANSAALLRFSREAPTALGRQRISTLASTRAHAFRPYATWALVTVAIAVTAIAFARSRDEPVDVFDLNPTFLGLPTRGPLFGVGLLAHERLAELAFHGACLLLVGSRVEEWITRGAFVTLTLVALIAGPLVHMYSGDEPLRRFTGLMPLVGALWTFLLLVQPRARISLLPGDSARVSVWILALAWWGVMSVLVAAKSTQTNVLDMGFALLLGFVTAVASLLIDRPWSRAPF